jgi:hypothetical protein
MARVPQRTSVLPSLAEAGTGRVIGGISNWKMIGGRRCQTGRPHEGEDAILEDCRREKMQN